MLDGGCLLTMAAKTKLELTVEQCREVAAWIASSRDSLPEAVRMFLSFHEAYLTAGEGDPQRRAVEAAGAVGSFGVEMFLTANGDIVVNELAPRVHNSGHYTI